MVGSTKDPEDGKAVAASVFAAVIVYAVRTSFFPPVVSLHSFANQNDPFLLILSPHPLKNTPV